MFTSVKHVLLTSLFLITILLGLSLIVTSQAMATPICFSLPTYNIETIQSNIIEEMISRFNPKLTDNERTLISTTIIAESQKNDVDPLLIASIIAAESSFRPKVVSPCDARGLMQITDCVSQIMNISNPFDIQQNISAGTRYLKELSYRFDQFELILAAYNAGPTRVARLGRVPKIKETINYIQRVTRFYENIHNQLLATVNSVIYQPIFNPITTLVNESQNLIVTAVRTNQTPCFTLSADNYWCEPERSIYFLIKA